MGETAFSRASVFVTCKMGMLAGYFAEGYWEGGEERKCEDTVEFRAELPDNGSGARSLFVQGWASSFAAELSWGKETLARLLSGDL